MKWHSLFGKAPSDTRVLVAMSGGVDSSVVAILLHTLGYNVVGCTLQLAAPSCGLGACCTGRDLSDVQQMCASINVPHVLVKARDEFKQKVIQRTVDSYAHGFTPSPCVWCNSKVRFEFLYEEMIRQRCDGFVTGHYAYVEDQDDEKYPYSLCSGVDPVKDQSYFLSMLSQDILKHVRFPLGNMNKTTVRRIARALNIPVAAKSDSQDLCFVKDSYVQTLWNLAPEIFSPGLIKSAEDMRVIGSHDGIAQYTIGQRKGIKLNSNENSGEALYVTDIKPTTNEVVVGTKQHGFCQRILLQDMNMFASYTPGMFVEAKIRARSKRIPARLWLDESTGKAEVEFLVPVQHVARGQVCVMYKASNYKSVKNILCAESESNNLHSRNMVAGGLIVDFIPSPRKIYLT